MKHLCLVVFIVALKVLKVEAAELENSPNCGRRFLTKRTNDYISKRIVGGSESQQGSWPWQAALLLNGVQWCGGSIIDKNWIVTTGACIIKYPEDNVNKPEVFTVVLGEHKLKEKESFEQSRKVERIILHPDYELQFKEKFYLDNDIALLRLSTPAIYDKYVRPICLLPDDMVFDEDNAECYVTGWGHTQFNGTQPEALREAKVKIVSHEVCNQKISYGGSVRESSLCAGFKEGGVDACHYDGGGPLSCQKKDEESKFYLTGLVSWGYGCAEPHKYGVYSNMMHLTPWVKSTIKDFEEKASKEK